MQLADTDRGATPGSGLARRPGSTGMKQISIAVVGSNRLFREGIEYLLRKPSFAVVAIGKTLAEALDDPDRAGTPNLVICDLDAEGRAEAQIASFQEHRAKMPGLRFVLLAEVVDPALLRWAMVSGVDALLSKDISVEVLRRSLELVVLGQQLFPALLAQPPAEDTEATPLADLIRFRPANAAAPALVIKLDQAKPAAPALTSLGQQRRIVLSERERQILHCLVKGSSNKAIARDLKIAEATVKVHIKGLLRKIGANNRTQAAVWVLHNDPAAVEPAPSRAAELSPTDAPDRRIPA